VQHSVLSARQLNRAVLARQLLLERSDHDITTALQHVGGLQTQYAPSGYVGLWSRLAGFERASLTRALEQRSVVQATLMRTTIHMVAAADFWALCAGVRISRREWWLRIARSRRLPDIDYEALAALLRKALADGPRKRADLVAAMEHAAFDRPLWEGAGLWLDMVRTPPSGTWEHRRADLYGLAANWVPEVAVTEEVGLRLLLTRYVTAFGPATIADAAMWAGVPRARLEPVAEAMEWCHYSDESGRALVDLPGIALPESDVPAPVRFLPTWDATLLAHCRRSGILPEQFRAAVFHAKSPQSVGTVLVDGVVAATWAWRDDAVAVDEMQRLTTARRREVRAEAERLTLFYSD
jgi:hypothetical protein